MPSKVHPKVTVVIPALNSATTILEQLEALCSQVNPPEFTILIVDNGSTDGTIDLVGSFDSRGVPVEVVTEFRQGINLARNAGFSHAPDGIVLLCDADDVVSSHWVRSLSQGVTATQWSAGKVLLVEEDSEGHLDPSRCIGEIEPRWRGSGSEPTFGGNCGVSKVMWERVHGFDNRLSGPGDEDEFFNRARLLGYHSTLAVDAAILYRQRRSGNLFSVICKGFFEGFHHSLVAKCSGGAWLAESSTPIAAALWLCRAALSLPKHLWTKPGRSRWIRSVAYRMGRFGGPLLLNDQLLAVFHLKDATIGRAAYRWKNYQPPGFPGETGT